MNMKIRGNNVIQNDAAKMSNVDKKNILKQMREAMSGVEFESEQEESEHEERIIEKIRSGAKLSQSELNYIRMKNPEAYARAVRMQLKREMLENKLKNCKTKEEVEDVSCMELGSIGKKDPDQECMINTIKRVITEFKKTSEYRRLPLGDENEKYKGTRGKDGDSQDVYYQYDTSFALEEEKDDNCAFDVKL